MQDRSTDDALVDAARAGDRAALDLLLRRHHPRLHAVCRRIIGSGADADDATQEALIRVVRGLERFDGRSAFSTWAYRIATNAALDELRRRGRRPALVRATGDDETDQSLERTVDPMAQRRVEAVADAMSLETALAALPEEHRVAVVLRDVADLDYDEIADILGIPLGTVKSRIARGRGRLVRHLTESGIGGDAPRPADHPGNRTTIDERPTT